MDSTPNVSTREQVATELVARSLRAALDADRGGSFDPYLLGLRDAYGEAAALTLDPAGGLAGNLATEVHEAVALYCNRTTLERAATVVVHEVMHGTRHPDAHVEWVGPLAFRTQHPGPPGVDHDYGSDWGEFADQRVSWRADPEATTGLLYAYDPTWNEYATLAVDIPQTTADEAVTAVRASRCHPEVASLLHALDFPAPAPAQPAPLPPVLQAEL